MDIKDLQLWELAKARVAFRSHFTMYLIINTILWVIWYREWFVVNLVTGGYPWPVYSMIGWGIGLIVHYVKAYISGRDESTQKEYEILRKSKNI